MLALSVRQPYAELILRGIKRIEYRTRPTRIVGERFYIYASKSKDEVRRMKDEVDAARKLWSNDLAIPGPKHGEPPAWLMELAELLILDKLPREVIVGSAVIEKCEEVASGQLPVTSPVPERKESDHRPLTTLYQWHLTDVERAKSLRKPTGHPQPIWFNPF
jgi:hypothetical protein